MPVLANSKMSICFLRTYRKWVVKIAIEAPVTVGDMAAHSHLTHRDMGNATMMLGTSLAM